MYWLSVLNFLPSMSFESLKAETRKPVFKLSAEFGGGVTGSEANRARGADLALGQNADSRDGAGWL